AGVLTLEFTELPLPSKHPEGIPDLGREGVGDLGRPRPGFQRVPPGQRELGEATRFNVEGDGDAHYPVLLTSLTRSASSASAPKKLLRTVTSSVLSARQVAGSSWLKSPRSSAAQSVSRRRRGRRNGKRRRAVRRGRG